MGWYAQTTRRRVRQLVADLGVLAWVVGCVLAARLVHAAVSQLAAPAIGLRDATHRVDDGIHQTGQRLGDVPLVGDKLRGALDPLTAATADVDRAAADFVAAVERLALVTGIVTAALPILAVVLPWLWLRLRYLRRSSSARRLLSAHDSLDLFALRALARQPLPALARIDPDPAAAWRRGDPEAVRALAALELAGLGLRPPAR